MYSHVYTLHILYIYIYTCKFTCTLYIVVSEYSVHVHMRPDGEMAFLSSVDVHVYTCTHFGLVQAVASIQLIQYLQQM